MGDIIRGKIVGATQITGRVCASSISAGDYTITIDPIEGGYRLSVTRGSDVQTMDLMDGVGIVGVEKTGSTGDVDSYRISFTDGSVFDYTIETNAAAYAAAELERVAAENGRKAAETSRADAELARESAETARAHAEDGRQSAEAARSTAEQIRASAESVRVAAENARVAAEDARVSAENTRAETFAGYENRIAEAESTAQSVRDDADSGKFNGKDAPKESVLYTPQSLTDDQQVQARENVGAASAERVEKVADALPGKLTEPAEGLAVGKYFRVAAIDENGHAVLEAVDAPKEGLAITPTGWPEWTADEQAAARERMGIPGNYELLEESIFEETVTYMSRRSDGQGNAYCLDAIMIYLETEHDDSNGSGRCAVYTDNGYVCDFYLGNLNNTQGSISTVKVYPLNGCWNSTARNAVNNLQSTTGYANIMNGYIKPIIKSGYIKTFYISGKIVAGSKLLVYGVRA